jgi:hypothetical protein
MDFFKKKKKEKPSPVLRCYTFDATEYKSRKGCGGSIVFRLVLYHAQCLNS